MQPLIGFWGTCSAWLSAACAIFSFLRSDGNCLSLVCHYPNSSKLINDKGRHCSPLIGHGSAQARPWPGLCGKPYNDSKRPPAREAANQRATMSGLCVKQTVGTIRIGCHALESSSRGGSRTTVPGGPCDCPSPNLHEVVTSDIILVITILHEPTLPPNAGCPSPNVPGEGLLFPHRSHLITSRPCILPLAIRSAVANICRPM